MKESTVKVKTTMLFPLILSAAFVTAAQANDFPQVSETSVSTIQAASSGKAAEGIQNYILNYRETNEAVNSGKEAQGIQNYILNYRETSQEAQDIQNYILNYRETSQAGSSGKEVQDIQNYILNYRETDAAQSVASASPSR
jgi:hypothetical protein